MKSYTPQIEKQWTLTLYLCVSDKTFMWTS